MFDGGKNPLDEILGVFLGGKKGLGDILIAAGQLVKTLAPKRSTDGINQEGKPVQVLMCETLLDGGTQDWALKVDGNSLRFQVDHALDSKTQGHLYLLSGVAGRRKMEYGGRGEAQIATVLQRWLDQFWSTPEQAVVIEASEISDESDPVFPPAAVAAIKLVESLRARQKKGK